MYNNCLLTDVRNFLFSTRKKYNDIDNKSRIRFKEF